MEIRGLKNLVKRIKDPEKYFIVTIFGGLAVMFSLYGREANRCSNGSILEIYRKG